MLLHMRTTLNIRDELLERARRGAAAAGKTLTRFIEDLLDEALRRKRKAPAPEIPRLPTYGSGGLQPGVDLDDSAGLLERMEGR